MKKTEKSEATLKNYAMQSLKKLVVLADDENIDTKQRLETYKWLCEMHFGKPSSNKTDLQQPQLLQLSFEGDLDKYSE